MIMGGELEKGYSNLEEKLFVEDNQHVKRDVALGCIATVNVPIIFASGAYVATKIENPLVAGGIFGLSALVATLWYTFGCYFFTPPSQRGHYKEKHYGIPSLFNVED